MTWWQRFWRRSRMETQLEKEMNFHLEQHAAELMARGHMPAEARRLARLALGGPEQVKEACRDARGTRWLEDFVSDFRYALRTLGQRRGFAAVALLTLALGTGATTVVFTVINGVMLKPLSYPEPDRLLRLQEKTDWSTQWGDLWWFAYPNYLDCKQETRSLTMAAWHPLWGTASEPGEAEHVDAFEVSSEFFSALGVTLPRGRAFLREEDQPGATPVAIISYGLWQRRFGGDPAAIGRPLVFEWKTYTVVGVTPSGLWLDGSEPDVFIPLGQDTLPRMQSREAHGIAVWARLRPGATLAQAQAELAVVGSRLAEQYPKSNKGRTFVAEPLRPDVGDVRSPLWLLLGAVSLVLLIACANLASLLLARAVSRERELAMRVALGAGRGRLARQCLTESGVLALAGGALGVLLASIGIRPFVVFWPGNLPRASEIQLDWRVLLFALGVSVACGFIFGLAPALRVPTRQLEQTLRAGARTVAGGTRHLHGALVVSEIALAAVLLVSAGMLGRTLLRLSSLDAGINTHNVLIGRVALSPKTLKSPVKTRADWEDILDRARHIPGVQSIAMIDTVPMREGDNQIGYRTSAAEVPDDQLPLVLANSVSPDYLKVTGIRLRKGRFFNDQDRLGSQGVAVIDDVMAQQAFPGQEPLGKHLWIGLDSDPVEVVGVVGHVRQWGAGDDDKARTRAQLYYPFAQVPDSLVGRWSELMSLAARTSIEPLNVVEPLRRVLRGATNDQVVFELNTMEQLSRSALARQRFLLLLFSAFAGLALLLACIGVYGVQAYLTSQRLPEIGVRMALGASATGVMGLVFRESLRMILVGACAGTAAAMAAGRLLRRLVEGMQPAEPGTFAVMILVLVIAALSASFSPARRAGRVDPMRALRQE